MPAYFQIVRYTLTTSAWTDIVCPFFCSAVSVLNEDNANSQLLRSDRGDSGSEMMLLPSATLDVRSPVSTFERGVVICSLKAQSGTGPVVARFTR
jgi:hypothetical protein